MSNTIAVSATLPAPTSHVVILTGAAIGVDSTLPAPAGSATVLTGAAIGVLQTLSFGSAIVRISNRRSQVLSANFPLLSAPFVDPQTGIINPEWHRLLLSLWTRTGGSQGVNSPNT